MDNHLKFGEFERELEACKITITQYGNKRTILLKYIKENEKLDRQSIIQRLNEEKISQRGGGDVEDAQYKTQRRVDTKELDILHGDVKTQQLCIETLSTKNARKLMDIIKLDQMVQYESESLRNLHVDQMEALRGKLDVHQSIIDELVLLNKR